jgi:hypothetical protein
MLSYNSRFRREVPKSLPFEVEQTVAIKGATPFDRSYLQYPVARRSQGSICDITYNSIDEVKKISSLSLVCRLNLSGKGLTGIPAEVNRMDKLQWIDLRKNNISEGEVQKFQAAKPGVTVLYDEATISTSERRLARIKFEANFDLENASHPKLDRIVDYVNINPKASLRVVIYSFLTRNDNIRLQKEEAYLTKYLKMKKTNPAQWKIETKDAETAFQEQQTGTRAILKKIEENSVDIYGTNFPGNFSVENRQLPTTTGY